MKSHTCSQDLYVFSRYNMCNLNMKYEILHLVFMCMWYGKHCILHTYVHVICIWNMKSHTCSQDLYVFSRSHMNMTCVPKNLCVIRVLKISCEKWNFLTTKFNISPSCYQTSVSRLTSHEQKEKQTQHVLRLLSRSYVSLSGYQTSVSLLTHMRPWEHVQHIWSWERYCHDLGILESHVIISSWESYDHIIYHPCCTCSQDPQDDMIISSAKMMGILRTRTTRTTRTTHMILENVGVTSHD